MYKKSKHTIKLLLLTSALVLFSIRINAQEVNVINNKGTIVTVNNNTVTTNNTGIAPISPLENDVWFDTLNNEIKIWDGTLWKNLNPTHTGTTGSVFFAGATGLPTEKNAQLFWDDTNNRLGIGTNAPTNKLHVTGAIRSEGFLNSNGTVGEPSYRFSGDTDTGIFNPAADEIGFTVGGIEAININEISNVTKVTINETLELNGAVLDVNNSAGTSGQILSSTITGTDWIDNTKNSVTTNNTGIAPATAIENDVWFDTLNNEIKIYDTIDGWKLITSISASTNIYTSNGTLTASRTITGASNSLIFNGLNTFTTTTLGATTINSGGATVLNATGGVTINNNTLVNGSLELNSTLLDVNNSVGTTGQILSSTITGTDWIDNTKNTVNTSTTAPATPLENDVWFDTSDTNHTSTKIWDGSAWVEFTPNKAARIFYPPSIAIDASTTGTGRTVNLYDEYFQQLDTPGPAIGSTSAPAKIPTYLVSELYFYVTDYDTTILTINSIDDAGLMTYSVDSTPTDDNTIINVVFVVK